jgi:hypothetical protein
MEELDKRISEIVRSTVKEFMESLIKGEIQAFLEEKEGQRNGYYKRDIGTRYGKINDLRVPRDRNNEFQTAQKSCCVDGWCPEFCDGMLRGRWISSYRKHNSHLGCGMAVRRRSSHEYWNELVEYLASLFYI